MASSSAWVSLGLCVVSVLLPPTPEAFPTGPPVGDDHPQLCQDMFPTGHQAQASQESVPFDLVVDSDCYSENVGVQVTLRLTAGADTWFEGFFIQARVPNQNSDSYGTFSVGNDSDSKTLNCFNKMKNAVSQSDKAHYTCKTFSWRAPEGFTQNLQFQATVVHETEEFWTGLLSPVLTYNAECTIVPKGDQCDPGHPGSATPLQYGLVHLVIALVLASILSKLVLK